MLVILFILPKQFKSIITKRLFFDTERVLLNLIWINIRKECLSNWLFSAFAFLYQGKKQRTRRRIDPTHPGLKESPRLQLHPATSRLIP